jgi:hypothetical protein
MGRRTSVRIAAASFGALGVMALMPAATAHAEAYSGELCNVDQNTWVRTSASYGASVMYTIPQYGGFRAVSAHPSWDWVYGHGSGQPDGWIPNDGRLYGCH